MSSADASASRSPWKVALDQNFPLPILKAVQQWLPVGVDHVSAIHPGCGKRDDWQLIVALACRGYTTLVSNDYHIVYEPRVLPAAHKTRLTLVTVESVGHDMIRATGALLLDLEAVLRKHVKGKSRVFRPRSPMTS